MIELMVVVAMILIIAAAMTTSVAKARTRAKVATAMQETREMTNAILAFEQYAEGRSLEGYRTDGAWVRCLESEKAMAAILGRKTGESGEQVPVLYNAQVRGDALVDPWGKPYEYMIDNTSDLSESIQAPQATATLPNYYRLTDSERGAE